MNNGYSVTTGSANTASLSVNPLAKMSKMCVQLCVWQLHTSIKIFVSLPVGRKDKNNCCTDVIEL